VSHQVIGRRAHYVLGGAAVLYLGTLPWRATPFGHILHAGFEAAVVAGIADWFAVSALFTRPLGFPFHTALIPRQRDSIANGIAQMVETELITREAILARVESVDMAEVILRYLDVDQNRQHLIRAISQLALQRLQNLSPEAVAGHLEPFLKRWLQEISLAPLLADGVEALLENGYDVEILDRVVSLGLTAVRKAKFRQFLYNLIEDYKQQKFKKMNFLTRRIAGALEFFKVINLDDATDKLQAECIRMLQEMQEPDHPVRLQVSAMARKTVDRLRNDKAMERSISEWKREVVGHLHLHQPLTDLVSVLRDAAVGSPGGPSPAVQWAERQLETYWQYFRTNPEHRRAVDRFLKDVMAVVVEQNHYLAGTLVRTSLQRFTAEVLVEFVQEKVGDDLQYVRISGTVVGFVAGLAIAGLSMLYGPYIRSLWSLLGF
jgi:uncharacterized membrane-anchored protein YjiN (DUF445 family)